MAEKRDFYALIEEIYVLDPRYKPDSYEFLMQALHFTQERLKRNNHVTGQELLAGVRDYAIEQFGPMARTVLRYWGINATDDFGNMVFNLLERKILSKTEQDTLEDFKGIYDFESAFGNVLRDSISKLK